MIHRAKSLPSLADLERPVDGYIRVSRVGDRSGESYISPAIQRNALEAWAAERGVELVVHEPEENVSGGTMDRPVFNQIMRRIRGRESGGIVVYKLDRFARTLVGGLTTPTSSPTIALSSRAQQSRVRPHDGGRADLPADEIS